MQDGFIFLQSTIPLQYLHPSMNCTSFLPCIYRSHPLLCLYCKWMHNVWATLFQFIRFSFALTLDAIQEAWTLLKSLSSKWRTQDPQTHLLFSLCILSPPSWSLVHGLTGRCFGFDGITEADSASGVFWHFLFFSKPTSTPTLMKALLLSQPTPKDISIWMDSMLLQPSWHCSSLRSP
jgi:hypothetical protein